MNQAYTFHMYADGVLVATIQETSVGTSSMSFRNETAGLMASSVLKSRHFHGEFDEWLAKNEEPAQLPFWATNGAAALYAYRVLGEKELKAASSESPSPPPYSES